MKKINMIKIKTDHDIEKMKASSHLAYDVLTMIEEYVKPGISTLEINDICHDYIISHGAIPSPLNYLGFPKSICTSVNHVVCHGIPNAQEILKEGDIINIDITTLLDEFHGDTSKTFLVGKKIPQKAKDIVRCCQECLQYAIDIVSVGVHLGDIGFLIQNHAKKNGFSVVKNYVGHGIGRNFHEEPAIPHFGAQGTGIKLVKGMVFTIEPMINAGDWRTKTLQDGWTAVTSDGRLSAQFEHTIAIKHNGSVEVLTNPS